ncbi:superoxide dismutase family protein [Bdellovibrio bacteriovorus]|uniref:superoxide dismutase family protein n=1 Tax=Bdellovibrio bacteriovorus TaxID=959 RepID=UPI0035A576DD
MIFFLFILGLTGGVKAQESKGPAGKPAHDKPMPPVSVILKDAQGKQVGDVNFTQEAEGVKTVVNLTGMPDGTYAFHIHEKGSCLPPEFKSAGDHFNPDKKKHGEVKGGPHAGDFKNVEVKSGRGHLEEINKHISLLSGPNSLLRAEGTSVVVHEKGDDYKSQPAGASGKRIACGVVKTPDRAN